MVSSEMFPPRGSGLPGHEENPPSATWAPPGELSTRWDWRPGKILLGRWQDRLIGDPDQERSDGSILPGDDRHVVTIAGSRAGKSRSVLVPNLRSYTGSAIVIDPKGELALKTAQHRRALGHDVHVLDPFRTQGSGPDLGTYNPLDELDPVSDNFVDDIGQVADALIVDNERDSHWTDAAKTLLKAIIVYMFTIGSKRTLTRMRRILLGAEGNLNTKREDPQGNFFLRLSGTTSFDGLGALLGRSFLSKTDRELSSILSVAIEQTTFLDSAPLEGVLQSSKLRLSALKGRPTTIYLCLPASRLATHFRWLRVIVTLGLVRLEEDKTEVAHPVLFVLEEFAALEYMRAIERAAAFMAGFSVRLWTVLQDLSQLKKHYRDTWETFVGNAGIVQAFGNSDWTTLDYLSRQFGDTQLVQQQRVWTSASAMSVGDSGVREHFRDVRLIAPEEIARHFARETNRQLLYVPGRPPIYIERLSE